MSASVFSTVSPYLPLLVTLALVVGILAGLHYMLLARHDHLTGEQRLPRQVVMLVLTIVSLVAIAVALPVSESTRNQIIGLIGVLVSGVIAFSSTTMVSNLMAGLVLRVNRPFRVGDFIRVEGHSGRVAEMGLLDTEIQTESRELIAFANTLMVNNPVSVVRASGAIISVDLSLGYDVHHSAAEKALLAAAERAELTDPFVQVLGLGDFAVTYRVAGLLKEVKSLLSARSRLHKCVLDSLHGDGIEIVSPAFMNQRPQADGVRMIPPSGDAEKGKQESKEPESVMFDKAEEAQSIEDQREKIEAQLKRIEEQSEQVSGDEKDKLSQRKEELTARLSKLNEQQKQQE